MTAAAPLVSVRDLEVRYGDRVVSAVPALDVRPGQCVAVVGESGSGKSTLLLAVLGLLNGTPARVSGSVLVGGTELVGASERTAQGVRGSAVSLVLQSPQGSLNPTMRLGRLARHALRRHGVRGAEARRRVAEALDAVRLPADIVDRYPHEVSGGQAQRFAIATAVALGAPVIAADEPTSALDVTVQAEVMAVLDRLRREQGTAVLLVSHDLALVSTVADHVVVMQDGAVVDAGDVDHVLHRSTVPYTRALLAAVPRLGHGRSPSAPAGAVPRPATTEEGAG
ncbi:ABC transporter ATP-binding protein [Cellulomonas sp. IC4_254]|uniref:ATP-binding cassette domain-containing protein n=1 Tax=Cellulomonas sp. IC4_254 TaxID=2714040 RepID=UPI00196A64ED